MSKKDKAITYHARKSLLFNSQDGCIKKEGGLFDVIIGAFDGVEVYEAVDNFLLYQLSKSCNKKYIGLLRDDGLAIFKNVGAPKQKTLNKIYKSYLKITT